MGDKQTGFSGIKLRNLELSRIKTDHFYCRAPTRNFECGGKLRVQKCEGLKQTDLPKALLKPRQTRDKSLCIESVVENRPIYHGEVCISNKLVPRFELHFPPFSLIVRVLAKV